jgi:hypothetical protein
MKNLFRFLHTSTEFCSTNFKNFQLNPQRWRIEVSLVIYRLPIIAPPMTDAEKNFAKLSELRDHETSYKCDFELNMEKDAM